MSHTSNIPCEVISHNYLRMRCNVSSWREIDRELNLARIFHQNHSHYMRPFFYQSLNCAAAFWLGAIEILLRNGNEWIQNLLYSPTTEVVLLTIKFYLLWSDYSDFPLKQVIDGSRLTWVSPFHQNQLPSVTEISRKLVAKRGWKLLNPTSQKIGVLRIK